MEGRGINWDDEIDLPEQSSPFRRLGPSLEQGRSTSVRQLPPRCDSQMELELIALHSGNPARLEPREHFDLRAGT
jgi:hypothetical protein